MKNQANRENVMIGDTDWYSMAGKQPLREKGFTPELIRRIEQAAADDKSLRSNRFMSGKRVVTVGLVAALLISLFVIPFDDWQRGDSNPGVSIQSRAAAPSPSPVPTSAMGKYEPPVGAAGFQINGKNYYMPLPLDRDKEASYAVDTSEGILWSPAPPMVNYTKPKYLHPTEPYSLYLSSKDQPELSAASARRLYTFPLYDGGAQTYNRLWRVYGVGNYALLVTTTETMGIGQTTPSKLVILDVKKAVAGEVVEPREGFVLDSFFNDYKSYIAVDKEHEAFLMVNINAKSNPSHFNKVRLYDLNSNTIHELEAPVNTEKKGAVTTAQYEVDGEMRTAEVVLKIGLQWYEDELDLSSTQ
jgi:hypothetical protein